MTLAAVVALLVGVVALLARHTEGSWVAPAPMFAAFWAGIMFVSGITFVHLDSQVVASLYVLVAATAVWVGSMIGHAFDPPHAERTPRLVGLPFIRTILVGSLALGLVELGAVFMRSGRPIREIFSLSAIIETVITNRADLFGGAQQSAGEWAIMAVLYTSTYLGGVLFRLQKSRLDVALAISPPILLSAVFALYGSRISALYGGAFWVGAYLATSVLVAERREVVSARALARTAMLTGGLILGLSIITQGLRTSKSMPEGWRGVFADGFDYPAAMGIWMDQRGFVGRDFTAGARGFTRIVGVVGIKEDPLMAIPVDFTSSNIYSFLRDAIEDFGTLGSLVFFVCVGWIGRFLFSRALAGRVETLAVLACFYACLLTSPAEDIFFYTITIAATVAFAAYGAVVFVASRRAPATANPAMTGRAA